MPFVGGPVGPMTWIRRPVVEIVPGGPASGSAPAPACTARVADNAHSIETRRAMSQVPELPEVPEAPEAAPAPDAPEAADTSVTAPAPEGRIVSEPHAGADADAAPADAVTDADTHADTNADASPPSPQRNDMAPAEVGARLAELFPALFTPGQARPIKLRIQHDIQTRAPQVFTKKALAIFFHRHTTSTAYLRALAAATERFDLDGAVAGELAAEHRDAAAAELARRKELHDARRAAERQARRQAERESGRPPRPAPAGRGEAPAPAPEGRHDGPARARPPRSAPRTEPPGRPPRPAPRSDRPGRPPRRDGPRPLTTAPPAVRPPVDAEPPVPQDPAQRERAVLLRAWEGSTLTKANFLALKRLPEAEFDAQIALAQAERAQRSGPRAKPLR